MQLTEEQIEFLNKVCMDKWKFTPEGKVDVEGNVDILNMPLTEIPVKFGKVGGWFCCMDNQLTTLENIPDFINYSFICSGNNLSDYFKSIKEEDFPYWRKTNWMILENYPFLINTILKNNKGNESRILDKFPQTKLYLK